MKIKQAGNNGLMDTLYEIYVMTGNFMVDWGPILLALFVGYQAGKMNYKGEQKKIEDIEFYVECLEKDSEMDNVHKFIHCSKLYDIRKGLEEV